MNLLAPKIDLHGIKAVCIDDVIAEKKTSRNNFLIKSRLHSEDVFFTDAYDPALEVLDSHPEISLAFIDIRIPRKSEDGYDFNPEDPSQDWGQKLIQEIPKRYTNRKIYIIVITAYTTIYDFSNKENPPFLIGRYKKPVDYDSLIKKIEFIIEIINNERQLPNALANNQEKKTFDYSSLDEELSLFIQKKTVRIKKLAKRAAQDIIDIGKDLIEVKDKLGHGNFYNWIDLEFSWSKRTAHRFMRVAERFESVILADLNILPTALYELAAPSAPKEATIEAIERAKRGETITEPIAKNIKRKYKSNVLQKENIEQSKNIDPETKEKESQNRQRSLSSQPSSELPQKIDKPPQKILAIYPSQKAVKKSWRQLGEHHQLFCGKPKEREFLARLPENIALNINLPPNNDSSLIPPIRSKCSFSYYSEFDDIDLKLVQEMVKNSILASTGARDIVVFSYIFDPILLKLAVNLGCYCYVAEPNLEICEQILAIWRDI